MSENNVYRDFPCNVCSSPVFVVGSSRSGTTLVYSLILSSGEFAIYEAETLLLEVCQIKYGNLLSGKKYEKFMRDWLRSKQFYRSGLLADRFKLEAKKHCASYTDFLKFFMESIAKNQGKQRWAEQTPYNLFHMDILSKAFPDAKFIHVIRDGRDVAISRRKLGWTGSRSKDKMKILLAAALSWEFCVKKAQFFGYRLGDNYKEIKYEELVAAPEDTLRSINDYAGITIEKEKINNCQIGSLGKGNTIFQDNMEGISTKGVNRWKTELSEEEKKILNIAIGKTLNQLGYISNGEISSQPPIRLILKVKVYSLFYRLLLRVKLYVRQKTFLGRLSSDSIEIGLQ
jgi:hypothetical protein